MNNASPKTQAALLTGSGRGAIASVLVCGTEANGLVTERFHNKAIATSGFAQNKLYFGNWRWKHYAEELVVCRIADDAFEIHCHGGNVASKAILESLADGGVEIVAAHDLRRATQSDRFTQAALELLANARTERVAALLLDQTRGVLRRSLRELSVLLEKDRDAAEKRIERLVELGKLGLRLGKPFSVVLIGRPNAGKSSLINALLGYERSIVFDQPGTTRDLVRAETAVDGWPILLTDTAGVRQTDDQIEREGVRLARQSLEACDLAILVQDLTSKDFQSPADVGLTNDQQRIVVGTKADLVVGSLGDEMLGRIDLQTSVVNNSGIDELIALIAAALVPSPPEPGEAIPLDESTFSTLVAIHDCVQEHAIVEAKSLLAGLVL